MKKWLLAFICALALLAPIEGKAVTTTKYALSSTTWTDLGVGPIIMSATGSIVYAIADTTPAIPLNEGLKILSGGSIVINTTSHVWAMNQGSSGASVYVAPILASSGGGSRGSYTLPTASTTTLGGVKIDGTSVTINGGGVISAGGSITAGTTPASGFVAGQLLYSDGTVVKAVKPGTAINLGDPANPQYMIPFAVSNGVNNHIEFNNGGGDVSGVAIYANSPAGNEIWMSGGSNGGVLTPNSAYAFSTGTNSPGGGDVAFTAINPGVAGFRNLDAPTSPESLRVYDTFTNFTNGAWGAMDWQTTPGILTIGVQANGTGNANRVVNLVTAGSTFIALNQSNDINFMPGALAGYGVFNINSGGVGIGLAGVMGFTAGYAGAAPDVAFSRISAGVIGVGTGANGSVAGQLQAASLVVKGTQPTITGCTAGTKVGGATAGTFQLGATCAAAATIAFTGLPATTNGYACDATNRSLPAMLAQETASTTTGFTLTVAGTSGASGNVVQWKCLAY